MWRCWFFFFFFLCLSIRQQQEKNPFVFSRSKLPKIFVWIACYDNRREMFISNIIMIIVIIIIWSWSEEIFLRYFFLLSASYSFFFFFFILLAHIGNITKETEGKKKKRNVNRSLTSKASRWNRRERKIVSIVHNCKYSSSSFSFFHSHFSSLRWDRESFPFFLPGFFLYLLLCV